MIKKLLGKAGIVGELMTFFWKLKLYWMIPLVVSVIILGILMFVVQTSPIAPFVYTLF